MSHIDLRGYIRIYNLWGYMGVLQGSYKVVQSSHRGIYPICVYVYIYMGL